MKAVLDFELSQFQGQDRITCRAIGLAGRIGCDGLNSYANQELSWFISRWSDVEVLIKVRSTDAYAEIEGAMAKVSTAVQKDKSNAAELGPLVDTLSSRYNYGLSLVNAAARGADLTKTTYTNDDVRKHADLVTIATELKTSLSLWQNGKYQDAGDHARRASGQSFTNVVGPLQAKKGNDAALQKALNDYAALSDKPGDANAVSSAQKSAIEAVAIAQQWVVGQFWTDPKLNDVMRAVLNSR